MGSREPCKSTNSTVCKAQGKREARGDSAAAHISHAAATRLYRVSPPPPLAGTCPNARPPLAGALLCHAVTCLPGRLAAAMDEGQQSP